MTATAAPFDSGAIPNLPMKIKNKVLLGIMIIPPLAALLALIDKPLLGGFVIDNMTTNPQEILYWTAILTIPHILASLITFCDREYIDFHKKTLRRGWIVSLFLGFGAPLIMGLLVITFTDAPARNFSQLLGYGSFGSLVIMAFYTMYHNLMQQYGIALMMVRQPPTFSFQMWRWFTIIPGGFAYTALMLADAHQLKGYWDIIIIYLSLCMVIATIFGANLIRTVLKNPNHTKIGLIYLLANMALIYICFGLLISGYGFLAMLVPRLTHDTTAFLVYLVHDQNRNFDKIRNPVYALPKKLGIQPWLACVPLALMFSAVLLGFTKSLYVIALLSTALNYMHYYMEGYMWKRGMPHRMYAPFV